MTKRKKAQSDTHAKKPKIAGCAICPGSPDTLQCSHTQAGRQYLAVHADILAKSRVVTPLQPSQTSPGMSGTQPLPQSSIGYSPGSSPPYRAPQSTSLNPYMRPALTQPQFHPAYAQTPYPVYSPQLMWSPGYPNTPQLVPPPNVMRQDNPAAYPNGAGGYYGAYLMTPPKSLHHDNPVAVQPPSVPSSHGQPGGVEPPAAIAGSHENTLPASAPAIHPAATLAPANERGPNSAAPTPETATAISQNAATIAGDSSGSTEDKQDGSDDDSDDSTPKKSGGRKCRVSASNALYGHVSGAMKGSKPMQIYRRKALPQTHAKPPRRFAKTMPDILARCERLAAETGCYLVVAAANRSSASAPLHYVSTSLRHDALKESTDMLNIFQTTLGAIKRARQTEAVALTKDLIKVEAEKARLEISGENARRDLAASKNQLVLQAQLIAELQGRLGGEPLGPGSTEPSASVD
ncbi:hypothetical protein DFH09DRAFT_1346953 [Mycena vulgaris]|nr:hypothetical protein DFH09DRAFT_1346953 [Mycena vulgaris]